MQRPKVLSSWICFRLLLLLVFSSIADSRSFIKTLPGFAGELPFKLETGYISVDEWDDVQLFYYFVESLRSPADDPLLLYMAGGPGCSGLAGFFFASGPLSINYTESMTGTRGLPTLYLNPYTWTKGLNIIYLDSPVGTGFSYAKSSEGYYSDDHKTVSQVYSFLQKWLVDHPEFIESSLYLGGDSYAGIPIPIIIQKILDDNEAGREPIINVEGYILGSPKTDVYLDVNTRVPLAHRLSLISDGLYKSAKTNCNGDYINIDPSNEECLSDVAAITELLRDINEMHILEPVCTIGSPKPNNINSSNRRIIEQHSKDFLLSMPNTAAYWCRGYEYLLSEIWANNQTVREALHIREGTKEYWKRCNASIAYTKDVLSTIDYHGNLSHSRLRVLIFSGDHDMSIPHISTQEWITSLNLTVDESWRPWFVDAQVAGYTKRYLNNLFFMTFATLKGAGHIAAEFKRKEAYVMLDRWLAHYPL